MSAGNLRRILWESEDQRDLCFAMIGGFYLLILTKEKKWSGKTFFVGLTATVVGFLSYLALTPAIWGQGFHLWEFLLWNLSNSTNFSRMDGKVLFDGTWYVHSTNPLPWYYLPKLIALTIPVYLSVLLWSSIGIWIYKGRKHQWDFEDRSYPLFALTSGIPVLAAMLCDPNLYNGWRHMYYLWTDDRDDGLCSEIPVAATGNPYEKNCNCYAGGAHRM